MSMANINSDWTNAQWPRLPSPETVTHRWESPLRLWRWSAGGLRSRAWRERRRSSHSTFRSLCPWQPPVDGKSNHNVNGCFFNYPETNDLFSGTFMTDTETADMVSPWRISEVNLNASQTYMEHRDLQQAAFQNVYSFGVWEGIKSRDLQAG